MTTALALAWNNETQQATLTAAPDDQLTWLKTAIAISLGTDAYCEVTELDSDTEQCGWWGDMQLPFDESLGSKLRLLKRRSIVNDTLNKTRNYATQAVQWLVDNSALQAVTVLVERNANSTIIYNINCHLPSGDWVKIYVEHRNYGV